MNKRISMPFHVKSTPLCNLVIGIAKNVDEVIMQTLTNLITLDETLNLYA
jgi:hypothetical protein